MARGVKAREQFGGEGMRIETNLNAVGDGQLIMFVERLMLSPVGWVNDALATKPHFDRLRGFLSNGSRLIRGRDFILRSCQLEITLVRF